MKAIWRLPTWFAVLLTAAVAVGVAVADPPASQSAAPGDSEGAQGAKAPAKPPVRVTISKETTYITEPLRRDGYVDYVAALNQRQSQGVTPENNAAVLFWKVMGPGEIMEKYRERYFQMLGIPALPLEGDYFVGLDKFAKLDQQPADSDAHNKLWEDQAEAMRRPWTKEEFPVLAGWIDANEKRIAVIVEGTKRPRCYEPLVGGERGMVIYTLLPGAQQYREMARLLAARAMLHLGAGEVDAAWDDLLACHRLARLASQGPTLVEHLVAIAVDGIACAADQALVQHPALAARQAKKMYSDLISLPPMRKMVESIDVAERFLLLDCVQEVAREGASSMKELIRLIGGLTGTGQESVPDKATGRESALDKALSAVGVSTIDWDVVLRMGNSWYDRLAEACRKPTRGERTAAIARIDEDLRKLAERAREVRDPKWLALAVAGDTRKVVSEKMGQVFVALLLPAVGAATSAEDRGAMQREVTRLGFALATYHADHGAYPDKLAALSPRYAAEIPKDVFTGGELIYRRQPASFILYSVGVNGKDDGGHGYDDRTDAGGTQDYDDLVVQVPAKPKPK